jgi:hypothetical protein
MAKATRPGRRTELAPISEIKKVAEPIGQKNVAGDQVNPTTEDTLVKLIPIAKAALFNTALPAAEADWLASAITPTNSPSYLRIYVCVSVSGVLRIARTIGATTLTEDLNSGGALAADAAYMFTVPWRTGDSINLRYSVTAGTIKILRIEEIGGIG